METLLLIVGLLFGLYTLGCLILGYVISLYAKRAYTQWRAISHKDWSDRCYAQAYVFGVPTFIFFISWFLS